MQTKIIKKNLISSLAALALASAIILPAAAAVHAQAIPAPVITIVSPQTVATGAALSVPFTLTDPNAVGFSNIAVTLGPTAPVDISLTTDGVGGGTIDWVPTTAGTFTFDIIADDHTATDASGNPITGVASLTINVTAAAVFTAPAIAAQSAVLGDTVAFTVTPTGGTAPYTFVFDPTSTVPATATLDLNTGVFSWVTDAVGTATFNIIATDSSATLASVTVPVTINVSPVPVVPTLTTITIATASTSIHMGTTQQFTATGFDQSAPPVALATQPTFTWTSSDTTVGTIDASGIFTALTPGTTIITAAAGTVAPGTISVNVTPALLVTKINPIKMSASPDGTYANGWQWVFDVTVPTNETNLMMKFADWLNGSNTIPTASNMQFFSAQSANAADEAHAISITAANTYSAVMNIDSSKDLDTVMAGRQIQITVETKIPAGSAAGSYSTSYGVNSTVPASH